jgi:hypothetical protein
MKGWIVIDPLTTDWSGIAGKRPSDAKHSLQQLIAHIAAKKLEDDVVCKLSVPLMGQASGTHEIEITVTDVMVLLSMGMNQRELTRQVTDMRAEIRTATPANPVNQQTFTASLLELQARLNKMFMPSQIAYPIVAELTKTGLMP